MTATKLLDDIGTVQVNKAVEARVIDLTKATADILEKDTGVEPSLGRRGS